MTSRRRRSLPASLSAETAACFVHALAFAIEQAPEGDAAAVKRNFNACLGEAPSGRPEIDDDARLAEVEALIAVGVLPPVAIATVARRASGDEKTQVRIRDRLRRKRRGK